MAQASIISPIINEKTTVTINNITMGFNISRNIILKTVSLFLRGKTFSPYFV